jgi:hypothetical protein
MSIIVGIDGGKNGAIAVAKKGKIEVHNMPGSVKEMFILFLNLQKENEVICFLEKVGAFIGEADEKRFGIIKMIQQVERLKTVLMVLDIRIIEVASVTWQAQLKLNKNKGLTKTERKRKYFEYAEKWASQTKFTIRQADAVCVLACGLKMIEQSHPLYIEKDFDSLDLF